MKKLIGAAIGAGMLIASISPAFAANLCDNNTTGSYSRNRCDRVVEKIARVRQLNLGEVDQNVNTSTNTGDNHSDVNNTGGEVDAGDAGAILTQTADLNTTSYKVTQSDEETEDSGYNEWTGSYSTNTVNMTTEKRANVGVLNIGRINQNVNTSANSGRNTSSTNTIGGSVSTGDATADVYVTSQLNKTTVTISQ